MGRRFSVFVDLMNVVIRIAMWKCSLLKKIQSQGIIKAILKPLRWVKRKFRSFCKAKELLKARKDFRLGEGEGDLMDLGDIDTTPEIIGENDGFGLSWIKKKINKVKNFLLKFLKKFSSLKKVWKMIKKFNPRRLFCKLIVICIPFVYCSPVAIFFKIVRWLELVFSETGLLANICTKASSLGDKNFEVMYGALDQIKETKRNEPYTADPHKSGYEFISLVVDSGPNLKDKDGNSLKEMSPACRAQMSFRFRACDPDRHCNCTELVQAASSMVLFRESQIKCVPGTGCGKLRIPDSRKWHACPKDAKQCNFDGDSTKYIACTDCKPGANLDFGLTCKAWAVGMDGWATNIQKYVISALSMDLYSTTCLRKKAKVDPSREGKLCNAPAIVDDVKNYTLDHTKKDVNKADCNKDVNKDCNLLYPKGCTPPLVSKRVPGMVTDTRPTTPYFLQGKKKQKNGTFPKINKNAPRVGVGVEGKSRQLFMVSTVRWIRAFMYALDILILALRVVCKARVCFGPIIKAILKPLNLVIKPIKKIVKLVKKFIPFGRRRKKRLRRASESMLGAANKLVRPEEGAVDWDALELKESDQLRSSDALGYGGVKKFVGKAVKFVGGAIKKFKKKLWKARNQIKRIKRKIFRIIRKVKRMIRPLMRIPRFIGRLFKKLGKFLKSMTSFFSSKTEEAELGDSAKGNLKSFSRAIKAVFIESCYRILPVLGDTIDLGTGHKGNMKDTYSLTCAQDPWKWLLNTVKYVFKKMKPKNGNGKEELKTQFCGKVPDAECHEPFEYLHYKNKFKDRIFEDGETGVLSFPVMGGNCRARLDFTVQVCPGCPGHKDVPDRNLRKCPSLVSTAVAATLVAATLDEKPNIKGFKPQYLTTPTVPRSNSCDLKYALRCPFDTKGGKRSRLIKKWSELDTNCGVWMLGVDFLGTFVLKNFQIVMVNEVYGNLGHVNRWDWEYVEADRKASGLQCFKEKSATFPVDGIVNGACRFCPSPVMPCKKTSHYKCSLHPRKCAPACRRGDVGKTHESNSP